MASVISKGCGIRLGLKLTTIFRICDFSGTKDTGQNENNIFFKVTQAYSEKRKSEFSYQESNL